MNECRENSSQEEGQDVPESVHEGAHGDVHCKEPISARVNDSSVDHRNMQILGNNKEPITEAKSSTPKTGENPIIVDNEVARDLFGPWMLLKHNKRNEWRNKRFLSQNVIGMFCKGPTIIITKIPSNLGSNLDLECWMKEEWILHEMRIIAQDQVQAYDSFRKVMESCYVQADDEIMEFLKKKQDAH
ncbi:hypothetical protein SESBI_09456 [Sesbania bispinosa]|nr:hypothetical protein SESBI_09456 [Sesbania bispinosa]